jgi:iron complex transport system substrate-binding protein
MKIVTLLPSATELVCGLGLRDDLVGVSHECDWLDPISDCVHGIPELHPLPAGMPQARTLAGNGMSAPAAAEPGA